MANNRLWILCIGTAFLIFGCGDKNDVVKPPGYVEKNIDVKVVETSRINISETKKLFDKAGTITLGDKYGKFELRSEGILIHPGENEPTVVNFVIDSKYKNIKIDMFIAPLPPDAKEVKEAGTVRVELFLDGRPAGRYIVDRISPVTQVLELENIKILTVRVDNQDGKSWFDWLILGVGE